MRPSLVLLLALAVSVRPALSADTAGAKQSTAIAQPRPALLDRLVGDWVLKGELAGKQTVHDVRAGWVLNERYVRLDEVSRDRDAQGRPAYMASIYIGWEPRSRTYSCIWLDSTAVAAGGSSCTARPLPDRIPFVFTDRAGTVNFANTFVYDSRKDRWEWQLDDIANGKHTPFGRVVLTRSPAGMVGGRRER